MTKQKLPNGDSVEVSVSEKGIILCKYDKTGSNVTNRTCVSLGDELVKVPFLCLVEKGGYCILWLQETSSGFVINIRKFTGLGLAGKIITLNTENKPDGEILNVLVQNGSLLTVEWSSQDQMFSGIFNLDGSIHTKETKIIHNTESLKQEVGKPTQENIKIEIVEKSIVNDKTNEKEEVNQTKQSQEVKQPIQQEPAKEVKEPAKEHKKASLEIIIPSTLESVKETGVEKQQGKQDQPTIPQTPRRGVPMGFTGKKSINQDGAARMLYMSKMGRQRMGASMGMRFI